MPADYLTDVLGGHAGTNSGLCCARLVSSACASTCWPSYVGHNFIPDLSRRRCSSTLEVELHHHRAVTTQVAPICIGPYLDRFEIRHPRFGHEAVVDVKATLLLPVHVECATSLDALSLAVVLVVGADQPVTFQESHQLRMRVPAIWAIPDLNVVVGVASHHCRVASNEGCVSLGAQHSLADVHGSLFGILLLGPHGQEPEAVGAGDQDRQQMLER